MCKCTGRDLDKWCNGCAGVTATVITNGGARAHGVIVNWIGPAECELSTGTRGVLEETYSRRH